MRRECMIWILVVLGLTLGLIVELAVSGPQFGRIEGRVIDESSQPIAKANVVLSPSGRSATTDNRGEFNFDPVPSGDYRISASYTDFQSGAPIPVTIAAGQTARVNIILTRIARNTPALEMEKKVTVDSKDVDAQYRVSDQSRSATAGGSGFEGSYKMKQEVHTNSLMPENKGNYACKPVPTCPPVTYYPSQQPQDMYFRDYGTNDFVSVMRDPQSTFGLDVDDASYNLAARYLREGNLPPREAIRIEEFVNHFDYDYNPPSEGRFRVFSEVAASPFDGRTLILKLGVKAKEISEERRKPINLILVLDISGSMSWGNRFDLVKQSVSMLVDQLDRQDVVGVVAYGSQAYTVLGPTTGDQKGQIMRAINRLQPGGSTFAEAGLKLGYRMANSVSSPDHSNVIVLCSDGVANVGETSPEAIMRDIKSYATQGISLSTFGFGMGNYNDVLLEKLAKEGNGRYAYVNDLDQARKLFVDGMIGTIQMVARDVKVQVEFNNRSVASYRLLGYESRAIADRNFRDDREDGGEIGSGHEVTVVYELIPTSRRIGDKLATVHVRWKNPRETQVTELTQDVVSDRVPRSFGSARAEFQLAVLAAKFAEALKQTEYANDVGFGDLATMARAVDRQLRTEQTRDLVSVIDRARDLTGQYSRNTDRRGRDYDGNYRDDDDD